MDLVQSVGIEQAQSGASRQVAPMRASVRVLIVGVLGLHARVALGFTEVASAFDASVQVRHDGRIADGKSIIQLLMLGAGKGAELEITAEGADAKRAADALRLVIERPLGEEP